MMIYCGLARNKARARFLDDFCFDQLSPGLYQIGEV
jgi:hypothetical protein